MKKKIKNKIKIIDVVSEINDKKINFIFKNNKKSFEKNLLTNIDEFANKNLREREKYLYSLICGNSKRN